MQIELEIARVESGGLKLFYEIPIGSSKVSKTLARIRRVRLALGSKSDLKLGCSFSSGYRGLKRLSAEDTAWGMISRHHGYDRMAQAVPDLERMIADADIEQLRRDEAPPWLPYARAAKPGI